MIVVFPAPVGPTIAIVSPGFAFISACFKTFLSLTYEKLTSFNSTLPSNLSKSSASALSFSGSSSITSNTLSAPARANCIVLNRFIISFIGLVKFLI